jgi:hypothetical protein
MAPITLATTGRAAARALPSSDIRTVSVRVTHRGIQRIPAEAAAKTIWWARAARDCFTASLSIEMQASYPEPPQRRGGNTACDGISHIEARSLGLQSVCETLRINAGRRFCQQKYVPHLRCSQFYLVVFPVLPHWATIWRASGAPALWRWICGLGLYLATQHRRCDRS